MANTLPTLNVHITDALRTDANASSFLDAPLPAPQPLGPASSMNYIYSTTPSFTLVDNADLKSRQVIASAGPPYHFPSAESSSLVTIDFAPNPNREEGFWHRTQTVDYIVVTQGEVELALAGGEKKILRAGDIVVQRAPMHKWKNLSRTESARYVAVLLGAQGAVEDGVEFGGEHLG